MSTPKKTYRVEGGFVTVPVVCPRSAQGSCDGRVWFERKSGKKTMRLGTGEFFTTRGQRDPVQIALTKKARQLLNKKKKLAATLRVQARDGAGKRARTSKKVQLLRSRGR